MDPIYRVQRRDDVAPPVERVVSQRLLTPGEREEARRRREAKRHQVAKKTTPEQHTQEQGKGTDYLA